MHKPPLVSVLMPFYDDGKPQTRGFFSRAVDSVLAQTYGNFELVLAVSGKTGYAKTVARRSRKISRPPF